MSQDDIRDESGESTPDKPVDRHVELLRGLPRLRSIEASNEDRSKVWTSPPPMVSRIGGLAQGCGGLLVTIMGVMMALVAMGAGFYLWGPALILAGGILLTAATLGVWSGRRTPVIVSIVVAAGLLVVGYFWQSFFPVVGSLLLGNLGMIASLISYVVVLLVAAALALNLVSLIFWKRLKLSPRRSVLVWAAVAGVLVILSLFLHFSEQQRRESWLNDHLDEWSAEASADSLTMGANSNVTLGFSFLTLEEDEDDQLDVRLAELNAELDLGASVIRLSASGDMMFEEENPRLFVPGDDDDADKIAEVEQDRADRIARQRAAEATFLETLLASDADLMLSDSQFSPYLIVWGSEKEDEDKLTWEDFVEYQQRRVEYFAETYQPAIYEIINDPEAYMQYTGLDQPGEDDAEALDLWIAQTERLIEIVHDKSPDSRIGVTIAIDSDFDLDYYERVLDLDGVDQIGFRAFQPATFDTIEDILVDRGHPVDHGKELWIVETWYGYCLAPQRSMELDATWLETVAAFAAQAHISAILPNDYGCFLKEGGTRADLDVDAGDRTDVWVEWQRLVDQWQGS